ncbi:HAD hydrolase-like protein [Acinetobacter pittii]|uniref:HAD hydrolase-like protein n=1 Tax=Acinetobacter pittii TaxID=48296 RepID=UPI00197EADCD|nr:HAD hydrolase-like protein [Acinetobacter pittii]MBN6515133.1 HAD hydrolase-like protein [Acinetobacter pittii]
MIKNKYSRITPDMILFFDMDGTLVDTDYANFLAYQQAISSVIKYDVCLNYNSNFRLNRNSLKAAVPSLLEIEYQKIIQEKENIYPHFLDRNRLYIEQVSIVVEYSRSNKIILVTNSYRDRAMAILNYFNLTNYFDEIFCQESMIENNQFNKFKNAISKLRISPKMVVVFENEESEVLLAVKAGIEIINPKMTKNYEKI